MTDSGLAVFIFLQLACILLACRFVGWIVSFLRQPQVIAEMVAGFLIGPSVLGWIAPSVHTALFPADTLKPLYVCSQVGVALYMFVVGLEFQTGLFTGQIRQAASVSVAGVVAPFALGGALGLLMLESGEFFTAGVTPAQAALFVGAALSITAFPMLARIIHEGGIAGTALGTLALSAGAMNDAAAWIALAIVVSSFSGSLAQAWWPVAGGVTYLAIVFVFAQPLLKRLDAKAAARGALEPWMLSVMLAALAAGVWFTDVTGIYSVFGAFMLGVAVPRGVLSAKLQDAIGPLTTALLIPLFFVYAGLNTQLALVDSAWLWTMTAVIFAAACAGKGLACWAAARLSGVSARDARGVATLMNARGMMELILINIALQRGLITQTTFTVLALMTIGTTLMAYPLFGLLTRPEASLRSVGLR